MRKKKFSPLPYSPGQLFHSSSPLTMLPEWAVSLNTDLYCGAFPPSLPPSSRDGADNKNRICFRGKTGYVFRELLSSKVEQ